MLRLMRAAPLPTITAPTAFGRGTYSQNYGSLTDSLLVSPIKISAGDHQLMNFEN